MVVVQGKPAGVNRRVVTRTSLSAPAIRLGRPLVEAGAMAISATAWPSGSISTTQAGSLMKKQLPKDKPMVPHWR
jgi:hypothetical protein